MSYLEPQEFTLVEGGETPFGNEIEVEVDTNGFLLPMNDSRNVVINFVSSTAISDIMTVSNFQPSEDTITICQDSLVDFPEGTILEISQPLVVGTTSSEIFELPEQKVIPIPSGLHSDVTVFTEEMEKKINEAINESVQLFNKDPREYHPFYLRVYKYVTIGQQQGFIPEGDDERLKVWAKYDTLAVNYWEAQKKNPTMYSGERSSYATYILTRKVLIDGKVVNQKRNEKERTKMFNVLERKAKGISKEVAATSSSIRQDFNIRLRFFNECCAITYPGDCLRMNNIWTKFCNGFGRESIEVRKAPKFTAVPPAQQEHESSLKEGIVLKSELKSPAVVAEESIPNMSSSPYSLPASNQATTVDELELKYCIPTLGLVGAKVEQNNNSEMPKELLKNETQIPCSSNIQIKQESRDSLTKLSKKTTGVGSQKDNKNKEKRFLRRKKPTGSVFKPIFKRNEPSNARFSVARKKLKLGLQRISSKSKEEEMLSLLEHKISEITRKMKGSRVRTSVASKISPLSSSVGSNEIKPKCTKETTCGTAISPEFSMCEECGQTYKTHYLKYHKEAVHNVENVGMRCPLCPQLFKGGRLLWSHYLSHHMSLPDHLNPTTISMQVTPIVKNLPKFDIEANKQVIEEESTNPPWDCPHCDGKSFTTKTSLQRHLHVIHGEGNLPENKLVCPECPKTFKEKPALTQHIKRAHQGLENRCDICSRTFQTAGKLWKHRADDHGIVEDVPVQNGGSIQCEQCGEYCLQGKQHLNHVKNHHPEMYEEAVRLDKEKRHERSKEIKRQARVRMKQNGIKSKDIRKPAECPICGRILACNLYRHMATFHQVGGGQIKTFCCPQPGCDKKYKSRASLRLHISDSHDPVCEKIMEQKLINVLSCKGATDRYQCTLCGFRAAHKYGCMVHLVAAHPHCLNDKNEPIKCPLCEETGKTEEDIRSHVKSIHPETAWKCPHPNCDTIILSPSNLQEHFFKVHGTGGVDTTELRTKNTDVDEKRLRRRRIEREWKARIKLRGPKVGHGFRKTARSFPCYRCTYIAAKALELNNHVKEQHEDAYWPCKNCSVLCFTERSKLFHEAVACKVKKQRPEIHGTVIAYDQITMVCPICDNEMKANGLSYHFRRIHGIIEDGDLWRCSVCNEYRNNFKTREYWLHHMDDCHGHVINLEELIEIAKKINSKVEVDIEKMRNSGNIKRNKPHKRKINRGPSDRKPHKPNKKQSRSGRTLKKRRWKEFDSMDSDSDDVDCKTTSRRKKAVISSTKQTRAGTLKRNNGRRKPVSIRNDKRRNNINVEKIMQNLPPKIRTMFQKHCTVRLERLTLANLNPAKTNTYICVPLKEQKW